MPKITTHKVHNSHHSLPSNALTGARTGFCGGDLRWVQLHNFSATDCIVFYTAKHGSNMLLRVRSSNMQDNNMLNSRTSILTAQFFVMFNRGRGEACLTGRLWATNDALHTVSRVPTLFRLTRVSLIDWLIEQGLTSHQTHYRSYRGRFL